MHKEFRHSKTPGQGIFGLLAVIVVIVLVLVGLVKVFSAVSLGKFSSADRFTIAVSGPKIAVISLSTRGKDAIVVKLPANMSISSVAHGYGRYPVSKIFQVGELDHRGGEVFSDSMSEYLGIPVDGFVNSTRQFSALKQYFFNFDFIFQDKSNLSFWDKVKFAQMAGALRFDKIQEIDLSKISDQITLNDNQTALSVDPETVDSHLLNAFAEEAIANEKLRIAVLNSTDVSGLGEKTARILTNIGANVVSVDTDNNLSKKCAILTSEKLESSLTVRRITAIFGCEVRKTTNIGRVDLIVKVGQDYGDKFTK